jgi:outer membrane protein assembly factor BamA
MAAARGKNAGAAAGRTAALRFIEKYLDSAGYFHPVRDTASGRPVLIIPGNRAVITGERIVNRRPPPPDSLDPDFAASMPYPCRFDAGRVQTRAQTICSTYTRNGYPFVSVTAELRPAGGRDSIALVFNVDPDERYAFAPPLLQGTFSTHRALLLRDCSIAPGAPFDDRAVARSIERLQSRNYIASVNALPPLITEPAPDTAGPRRRLVAVPLAIADRSGLGLDGAAGLESGDGDRPRMHGNVRFAFTNLFHAGEEAALSYAGDRTRQRLDLEYSQPRPYGLPLDGTVGGGLEVVGGSYGYLYGTAGVSYEPALRWVAGVNFNGTSVSRADSGGSSTFAGADIALARNPEPYRDGARCREMCIVTGGGVARGSRMYSRSHLEFVAGVHVPTPFHAAIMMRGGSGHIVSRETGLVASELYRIGGRMPVRGYLDNEYAFRTMMFGQFELLYYFQQRAPLYLFVDGGIGFENNIDTDRSYRRLAGYGLGVRLPARVGSLCVELARNIQDVRDIGRIHVRFQNSFSAADKFRLPSSREVTR